MGDIIEFTSWQNHKNFLYKVTSNGINFDIKSHGPARIGLTQNLNKFNTAIWVTIGNGEDTTITNIDNKSKTVKIRNILNREEYKKFWISWVGNHVALGQSGEKKAILQCKHTLPEIKYVTFDTCRNGSPVQWRLELPPILKEPALKPLSNGKLKWVPCSKQLPNDAVIGGFNNEILYIIRAKHRGSLTPGAFVPSEGCGYIPWGGESHDKTEFEVLCGIDYKWVSTKKDAIPIGAMEAGYSEVHNEPLYVGRALYKGSIIPGKVQPSHRVCYIYSGDSEIAIEHYEILTIPDKYVFLTEQPKPIPQYNLFDYPTDDEDIGDVEDDDNGDDYYDDEEDDDDFVVNFL